MGIRARSGLLGAILVGTLMSAGPAAAQPEGSYLDSCRDVQLYQPSRPDGLLLARCRDNRGRWTVSSLRYKTCTGDIVNENGNLACGQDVGDDFDLPPGNWRASCRGAYIEGSILYADCRNAGGRWQQSALNLNNCLRGPVANDNGNLVCGRGGGSAAARLTLYSDANFGGSALQLTGPAPDLRDYDFNDLASSLRVQGPWYVCTDINYRGDCTGVTGAFNLKSNWDNRISSARPGP